MPTQTMSLEILRRRALSKEKKKKLRKIIILKLCAVKESIYSYKSIVNLKKLVACF